MQSAPGSIEVSIYEAPLAPGAPIDSADRRDARAPGNGHYERGPEQDSPRIGRYSSARPDFRRRFAVGATAAFLSLAFHAAVVTSLLWTGGSKEVRPRDAGTLGAIAPEAADDGALKVVLIQDMSAAPPAAFTAASTPLSTTPAVVAIPSVDALANVAPIPEISVDATSTVSTPAPDAALRSAMYGRYVGQIDARIERAWLRPRTAIGAPSFGCLVRIDQDSHGMVLEVTLEHCNGSERWQQSLVSAIESASPLPAPPDPAVFTQILHMSFQSQPYHAGAPRDAYEPPLLSAAQLTGKGSAEDQNERALAAFGRALREPTSHQVISLKLTGSPTGGAPTDDLPVPAGSSPAPPPPPSRPPGE